MVLNTKAKVIKIIEENITKNVYNLRKTNTSYKLYIKANDFLKKVKLDLITSKIMGWVGRTNRGNGSIYNTVNNKNKEKSVLLENHH